MSDNINHPEHYQNIAGVEAIDILNDVVKDLPGKQAALLWNALKYQFRFNKKNGVEDLKKARNYLTYMINEIESPQSTSESNKEILWETLFSNEYGNMTIFSKSSEPDGKPSKLVFETRDAAEEFQSVLYNMMSEGYTEFSIADVALEMKFKITKGNEWNKLDELVYWDRVLDYCYIHENDGKYELIFDYKLPDLCVKYELNNLGHVEVYYSANMYPGMCTTILFDRRSARKQFSNGFFKKLTSKEYKPFSIRDVLSYISASMPEGDDCFSDKVDWKGTFTSFALTKKDGKFALVFYYKDSSKDTAKSIKTDNGPCVIYESKISGHVEVYYSMHMYAGTCTSIAFTSDLCRDMFIASFFNKLYYKYCKLYSIRDVLNHANYVIPNEHDNFSIELPWKDLFSRFKLRTEDDKYILDFVYQEDAMKILESSESMKPANNMHILYKSTVWGDADVYYSKELLAGTCEKILFDDEDGRNAFAVRFFRYIGIHGNGFALKDVLEDAKYMFHKEDTDLCVYVPWNEIFAGFKMYEEAGRYALEFVYKEETQVTDNVRQKAKVDKAIIIVTGTKEEPYFEILYHLIGDADDRIGFGSYCLTNVFNWREQYLEVVNKEDK